MNRENQKRINLSHESAKSGMYLVVNYDFDFICIVVVEIHYELS